MFNEIKVELDRVKGITTSMKEMNLMNVVEINIQPAKIIEKNKTIIIIIIKINININTKTAIHSNTIIRRTIVDSLIY